MKRQNLNNALSGATCVLLALGALAGCVHKPVTANPLSTGGSVQVLLHGPAIMQTPFRDDGKDGIKVSVPRDAQKQHELASPDMLTRQSENDSCEVTFEIKLEGVQPFTGKPRFAGSREVEDTPFRAIGFRVPDTWKPSGDSFVTMAFPSTHNIDFLRPLYPVRFEDGATAEVPLTEVLEYPATDISKVRLVETRVSRCGTAKPSKEITRLKPLSCEEARERYQTYLKTPEAGAQEPRDSERPYLKEKLEHCAADTHFYFLGVGLPPGTDHAVLVKHGVDFFNRRLLPAIYGSERQIPRGRRLLYVGEEADLGASPRAFRQESPKLLPAVFKYRTLRPLVVPVASTENCTAPGAIIFH